ncbi:MAG: hypothetical protein HOP08_09315 [Cyclobacteriaceae bacterium]|nr:hypothetical protein [Cyclobacteriaceae bacterium]
MSKSILRFYFLGLFFFFSIESSEGQPELIAGLSGNQIEPIGQFQGSKIGQFDLRNYNFEKDGQASLTGIWEFHWRKMLTPDNINLDKDSSSIHVPGSWHRQGNYPSKGYATYRATLLLSPNQPELSMYFPYINSASRIWMNGRLVTETGIADVNEDGYKPQLANILVTIPSGTPVVEIVIQAVNYSYFSAGVSTAPRIDKTSTLFRSVEKANGIENFFAGSLMSMFIYQIILYFLIGREKPYLWLALICLGVAIRSLIVHGGSFLLPNIIPSIDWELWKKLEFGSVYAVIAFFPLYIYHLFPGYAPKKPVIFFVAVAVIMCTTVIVTNQYIYGALLELCNGMLLLTFIYAIYSILKAWRAKSNDAKIILLGVLAAFPFILTEIIQNSRFFYPKHFEFMYLVELGLLAFLLFQVYLLANHYGKAYRNLESLNLNLEKIVTERTSQLTTANTVKDRLLSVMSHDIKSPLNSLRGILQIYNKGSISQQEFGHFAQHIENDLSKTNLLVENIVFWTASQLKGVVVKKEKFNLGLLTEEIVQLFQTMSASKQITLNHNVPNDFMIISDRNILNFVIRNMIANAVKFSFEGGEVNIIVSRSNEGLLIQIKDKGVGMNEITLASLLRPDRTMSTSGTSNEKGTGLGLALCLEYLQKLGGQLSVESIEGKGSMFSIVLPTETEE